MLGVEIGLGDPPGGAAMPRVIGVDGIQRINSFREPGYGGPCPPAGKPHRYVFTLRALSRSGRVLAEASLAGRFRR